VGHGGEELAVEKAQLESDVVALAAWIRDRGARDQTTVGITEVEGRRGVIEEGEPIRGVSDDTLSAGNAARAVWRGVADGSVFALREGRDGRPANESGVVTLHVVGAVTESADEAAIEEMALGRDHRAVDNPLGIGASLAN